MSFNMPGDHTPSRFVSLVHVQPLPGRWTDYLTGRADSRAGLNALFRSNGSSEVIIPHDIRASILANTQNFILMNYSNNPCEQVI